MSNDNAQSLESVTWLEARLRIAGRRHFLTEFLSFAAAVVSIAVLVMSAYALADYLTGIPRAVRVLLTLGLCGAGYAVASRHAARRTFRFRDLETVARRIEQIQAERAAGPSSMMISAYEFGERPAIPGSVALKNVIIRMARETGVDPATVRTHDPTHVRVAVWSMAAALAVMAAWLGLAAPVFKIFLQRAAGLTAHYPTATRVMRVEWQPLAPARQDYVVRVLAAGRLPSAGAATVKIADRRAFDLPMAPTSNGWYVATVPGPDQAFWFSFALGDYVSDRYAVKVRTPVSSLSSTLEITPPAYTGLPRHSAPLGSVTVPEGARVTLKIKPDRPLRSCELMEGTNSTAFSSVGATEAVLERVCTNSLHYQIRMVDKDGFGNDDRTEYDIHVVKDSPPKIQVVSPLPNTFACNQSVLKFGFKLEDDYGISSASVDYEIQRKDASGTFSVAGKGRVPVEGISGGKVRDVALLKNAGEFGAAPDDTLVFRVGAVDTRPDRPNRTDSDPVAVLVVTPADLRKAIEEEQMRTGLLIAKLRDDEKKQAEDIAKRLKGATP